MQTLSVVMYTSSSQKQDRMIMSVAQGRWCSSTLVDKGCSSTLVDKGTWLIARRVRGAGNQLGAGGWQPIRFI